MNFNKKKATALLVAFILVWGGNLFWYNHKLLKSPMFVKCYYDIPGITTIRLHYFQNISDNNRIVAVTFPELNNEFIPCIEFQQGGTKYYKMKEVQVNFFSLDEVKRITKGKEVKLTKANIQFSNGKSKTVSIGEIYLNPNPNDKPLFKYNSQYANSDNEGGTICIASDNGVIKGINDRFSVNLKDIVKLEVNSKLINPSEFPVKIKSGDTINVKYNFSFINENDVRRNYFYQLSKVLNCENSQGEICDGSINISYVPDLYKIDVKKLEKEGE